MAVVWRQRREGERKKDGEWNDWFWADEGKREPGSLRITSQEICDFVDFFFFFSIFLRFSRLKSNDQFWFVYFLFVQRRSFLALACGSPPGSGGSNYFLLVS